MIQVVDRALNVLEYLANKERPVSGTEIAREMGISLQCANNLLRTLYRRGYVTQDGARSYSLGSQCVWLGSFADRYGTLRRRLETPMSKLLEDSGMTVFCGVMENDRLLCVSMLSKVDKFAGSPRQNWWGELHSTACGRVLLASMTPVARAKFFARSNRGKLTESTVVDAESLEKSCMENASRGYAEICGESRKGICSLAIPLCDLGGSVIAGLAISSSEAEWNRTSLETKLAWLRGAAALF